MGMNLADLTVAVGLSRGYQRFLQLCLATIPDDVRKVISWYGPGEPGELPPNTRLVRPMRQTDNYMRGYVLNVAFRAVETPYVLIADADCVFPRCFFRVLEPAADRVLRFYVGRMTKEATARVLRGTPWELLYADYQGHSGKVFESLYGAHNPCLYATDVLHGVRGYDEQMIGWGREDDDLTERTRRLGVDSLRVPVVVACLDDREVSDYPAYRRGVVSRGNIIAFRSRRGVTANDDCWGDQARAEATIGGCVHHE